METSFSSLANKSIKGQKEQLRDIVLKFIRSCDNGATSEEVVEGLNLTLQTVSARMSELKALDKIKLIGKRPTKSGRSAGVWAR